MNDVLVPTSLLLDGFRQQCGWWLAFEHGSRRAVAFQISSRLDFVWKPFVESQGFQAKLQVLLAHVLGCARRHARDAGRHRYGP